MAHPLIGLIGRKRSGKDTFAARLVDEHGYTRLAFADALREAVLALDPIVEAEGVTDYDYGYGGELYPVASAETVRLSEIVRRDGWEKAKETPEVRRTLQEYGCAIRALKPDFWLSVVRDRAAKIDGPVVVTDVRFPNEATWVEYAHEWSDHFGHLVRIVRPDLPSDDTHVSETALDDWQVDRIAFNCRDRAHLWQLADAVAALAATEN